MAVYNLSNCHDKLLIYSGGVVKKLKHLTMAIRLDYHEFINSVEQTLFYAAQQAEASLENYHPPTVLVRR